MFEQTATNPQTGEKMALRGGQWVPVSSGPAPARSTPPAFIPGPAKQPDAAEEVRLAIAQRGEQRDERREVRDNAQITRDIRKTDFSQTKSLRDEYNSLPAVKGYASAVPVYASALSTAANPAGDLALINAVAKINDPSTGVLAGESDAVGQSQPAIDQFVAQFRNQLDRSGQFSPEAREELRREARRRIGAWNAIYLAERARYKQLAEKSGYDAFDVVGEHVGRRFQDAESRFLKRPVREADYYGNPIETPAAGASQGEVMFNDEERPVTGYRLTAEQEAEVARAIQSGDEGRAIAMLRRYSGGEPSAAMVESVRNAIKSKGQSIAFDYGSVDERAQAEADRLKYGEFLPQALEDRKGASVDATARGVADIYSFGLADDAAAIGRTLFQGGTLRENQQRENAIDEADRRINTAPRVVGQIGGAIFNPLGRFARSPAELARAGGAGGALYGFGSGDNWTERGVNTVTGGVGGALAGYATGRALQAGGRAVQNILNTPERVAAREARALQQQNALEVTRAAKAERVPISRALIDPALENRVTGAQATIAGGPIVDRSLDATARGIEGRVNALGQGGQALEPPVLGDKITGAATRWIKQSGQAISRVYNRADELSQGVKLPPEQSLNEVDGLIKVLEETPNTNSAELGFLRSLRQDLASDLSVGGLRRIRTSLRKKIARGELVFGEDEARVLGIMERASEDITNGLRAQGRGEAADAFANADRAYAERMGFIQGTVQKIIGKRGQNVTAEQVASRFNAMASPKGDGAGFGRVMRILDPEEQADVAATFADALGKNNKGEFSTAHLLSQAQKLPGNVRRDLFGEEGAESLNNLLVVAREHNRVTGKLNNSRSGVAVMARDYRSWLSGLLGVGTSLATSDIKGLAVGAAAGAMALGRDAIAARALMTRDVSKWLRQAPRTTDPASIDRHMRRLNTIASRNPMIASEIGMIQQRIVDGIMQLPGRAAASGPRSDDAVADGRKEPPR